MRFNRNAWNQWAKRIGKPLEDAANSIEDLRRECLFSKSQPLDSSYACAKCFKEP